MHADADDNVEPASKPSNDATIIDSGTLIGGAMGGPPSGQLYPGNLIGRYEVVKELGEGGFGSVYLCKQSVPIKRNVAVKIIKAGMDSTAVVRRFEAERQALAVLDHAAIAKVFDAGVTEQGRPYFVMEYVPGQPINEFCDEKKLDTRGRLALFAKVCEGIQHAHQKGIIHRDLKPGNVLVSSQGQSEPMPKIIDFGIAKATGGQLTEETLVTQVGQMMGTPEYMSPEQAEGRGDDIDTRSDVYSLGVILYELLAGRLPFEPEELRARGYAEIQRIIREETPPKPSRKLTTIQSTSDAEATRIAQARMTTIENLSSSLRKELEWIPLKALRKERTERYSSAEAMGQDVGRYLSGDALEAGPESASYRFKKALKRNKGPAVAAALVTLALIGGAIASTIFAVRAAEQADIAREQRLVAESKEQEANEQRRIAVEQAELAQASEMEAKRQRELAVEQAELARASEEEANTQRAIAIEQAALAKAQAAEVRRQAYFSNYQAAVVAAGNEEITNARRRLQSAKEMLVGDDEEEDLLLPFEWHYLDAALDPSIWSYEGGLVAVYADLSPDNRRIALATEKPEIEIIDLDTGEVERVLTGHGQAIRHLQFNEDGSRLFSYSRDGTTRIWNAEDGSQIDLRGIGSPGMKYSSRFAINGDETRCILVREGAFETWDIELGEKLLEIPTHSETLSSLDLGPDGAWLATSWGDDSIRIFDMATGEATHVFDDYSWNSMAGLQHICVSPDGRLLAGNDRSQVVILDAETGEELRRCLGHEETVKDLAFNPDGTQLVSGSSYGRVHTWDVASGEMVGTYMGSESPLTFVRFGPRGDMVLAGDQSGWFRCWNTGESVHDGFKIEGADADRLKTLEYSPDGRLLALPLGSGVQVWDNKLLSEVGSLWGHEGTISMTHFAPDGTQLASVADDNTIRIWCLATGECLRILEGGAGELVSVRFSPDGLLLATTSDEGAVWLWDVRSGAFLANLGSLPRNIGKYPLTFSSDSRWLAASGKRSVRIWDLATGEIIHDLDRPANETMDGRDELGRQMMGLSMSDLDEVIEIAFNPAGGQIAIGYKMGSVVIWNLEGDPESLILQSHEAGATRTKSLTAMAYSPGGQRIATGGQDKTVRISDTLTGEEVLVFDGFKNSIMDIAFSPDGRQVVISERGGRVHYRHGIPRHELASDLRAGGRMNQDLSREASSLVEQAGRDPGRLRSMLDDAMERGEREEVMALRSAVLRARFENVPTYRNAWQADETPITGVRYSRDGTTVSTGGPEQTMITWDPTTGRQLQGVGLPEFLKERFSIAPNHVASSDGGSIAGLVSKNTVMVHILDSEEAGHQLVSDEQLSPRMALSSDGQFLAVARKNDILVWDVTRAAPLQNLIGHRNSIMGLDFVSHDLGLVSQSRDGTVRIWNWRSGEVEGTFNVRGEGQAENSKIFPRSCDFLSDDSKLYVGTSDGRVLLFDTESGKLISEFQDSRESVDQIMVARGGDYLVTRSDFGGLLGRSSSMLRIRDIDEMRLVFSMPIRSITAGVAMHPERFELAVAKRSGELEIWDFGPDSPVWDGSRAVGTETGVDEAGKRHERLVNVVADWIETSDGNEEKIMARFRQSMPGRSAADQSMLRALVVGELIRLRTLAVIEEYYRESRESGDADRMYSAMKDVVYADQQETSPLAMMASTQAWQRIGKGLPELEFECIADVSVELMRHANAVTDESNPDHLAALATLLARNGDAAEAMEIWTRVRELQLDTVLAMFNDALVRRNAAHLNNLAWAALTGENWGEITRLEYKVPFKSIQDMCLDASVVSCELTNFGNWSYLDTLSRIHWKRGEVEEAIQFMQRAVDIAPEGEDRELMVKWLEYFQRSQLRPSTG